MSIFADPQQIKSRLGGGAVSGICKNAATDLQYRFADSAALAVCVIIGNTFA